MKLLSRRSRDDRPINSRSIAAVAAGVLTGAMLLAAPADAAPPSEEQLAEFTKEVKLKNLMKHLEHLQRASDQTAGTVPAVYPGTTRRSITSSRS